MAAIGGALFEIAWQVVVEQKSIGCLDWGSVGAAALTPFGLDKLKKLKRAKDLTSCTLASFAAGTQVHTPDGPKAIEQIRIGDQVLARRTRDGTDEYAPVEQLIQAEKEDRWARITVQDATGKVDVLEATQHHPFFIAGQGWRDAGQLRAGDRLAVQRGALTGQTGRLSDELPPPRGPPGSEVGGQSPGEIPGEATAEVLEVTVSQRTQKVFNFSVADADSYFVGDVGAWVHNAKCGGRKPNVLGKKGEQFAQKNYGIGPKESFKSGSRDRIADGSNPLAISEVKYVARQALTQQLRDSAAYAASQMKAFNLYVRTNTVISAPLQAFQQAGSVNILKVLP